MSFDDGDFLPEMLQYFDEFCSRIDDDNKLEVNVSSHPGPSNASIVRERTDSTQPSASLRRQHIGTLKLTRKTSFGRLCRDISSSQLSIFAKAQAAQEENIDWKKRFEELQRQYDMKCGELTNTTESANKRSNALLATIRNLETALSNERIESSKAINALQSQLSFKEADYRLITTELQNCKNLLLSSHSVLINKETFPLLTQVPNCAIASPGSYLLAQEADRVEGNYSMLAGPLPRAVSPVVTRGPPLKRPRLYSDDSSSVKPVSPCSSKPRLSIPFPDFSEAANPPTPIQSPRSRALDADMDDAFIVAPSPPFRSPSPDRSHRKSEKSSFCVDPEPVAQSLFTSTLPQSPTPEPEYCRLDFRLRRRKKSSKVDEIFRLVLCQLTSLLANTRSLTRDPELPGRSINEASEAEQTSKECDFFNGLSQLTLNPNENNGDESASFNRCIQLTLPLIRLRFREYLNFFNLFRERVFDHRFTEHWQMYETPPEESSMSNGSGYLNLEHLAENPFAGAPASQLVSVPSICNSKSATVSLPIFEVTEPSTWLESTAKQANEGILACLRQTRVLFHAACSLDKVSTDAIGNFILEAIDSLSSMLSITPFDDEAVLNPLPPLWLSRLTYATYECLDFASLFALELCKTSRLTSSEELEDPSWLPSLLDVFLLVVSAMCSKATLEEPPVLLPSLRLLTHLIESGNLESPLDPETVSEFSPNRKTQWFLSDHKPERGFELLAKLVELEESYSDRDQTYVPYFASRFLSKEIAPSKHLRCPLLLLCRLLFIEQHSLNSEDILQHCCLLTEFAKFTVALAKLKDWVRYPYSAEIYKALLRLCKVPTRWLSRSSLLPEDQRVLCLGALGCSIQALQTLLCRHKYKRFRYITDRIPGFFTTISTLSRLCGKEAYLVHPDLVYELHDFDRPAKSKKSKKKAQKSE